MRPLKQKKSWYTHLGASWQAQKHSIQWHGYGRVMAQMPHCKCKQYKIQLSTSIEIWAWMGFDLFILHMEG